MSRTMPQNYRTAGTKLPLNLPILSVATEKQTVIVLLSLLQVMKRGVKSKAKKPFSKSYMCRYLVPKHRLTLHTHGSTLIR